MIWTVSPVWPASLTFPLVMKFISETTNKRLNLHPKCTWLIEIPLGTVLFYSTCRLCTSSVISKAAFLTIYKLQ